MNNKHFQDIKTIAVLCGTPSLEHEVSLVSAAFITKAIQQLQIQCDVFWISKQLQWFRVLDIDQWLEKPNNIQNMALEPITPVFGDPTKQWQSVDSKKHSTIDFIIPIIHGHYGEDGAIQGLLQFWNIPYLGPKINDAVLTYNKALTKILLEQAGIQTTPWFMFGSKELAASFKKPEAWQFPLFIKAACGGSSIGVFKAHNEQDLQDALEQVFCYDDLCIVESGIIGQELEVAVLIEKDIKAVGPGELLVSADFYDYKAKYIDDSSMVLSKANISDTLRKAIQKIAIDVCKVLQCKSLARVDFLLDDNNNIYVNEVNSIPGFTPISLFPKLWQEAGVEADQLLKRMMTQALTDYNRQQNLMHNAQTYVEAVINNE